MLRLHEERIVPTAVKEAGNGLRINGLATGPASLQVHAGIGSNPHSA